MTDVDAVIATTLSRILKRDVAVGEEVMRSHEPNWDSLRHIEIIFALEGALGIRFDETEMSNIVAGRDLKRLAESKLSS